MPNRYFDAPIIYTRTGLSIDTFLGVTKKYNAGFNQDQFAEITQLKITSLRDKLRDLERYGFIKKMGIDTYIVTDDGKSIIAGGLQRSKAIEAAVNRSPLWKELIATIGKNPDRALFDKKIKSIPSLINIDTDSLDNLWSAYNADVQCITKDPPFASRLPFGRKIMLEIPSTFAVELAHTTTHTQNTQPDNSQHVSGDGTGERIAASPQTHSKEEQDLAPGKVEYRGHVVVVTDDLTAKFAESLVKKMIKDLKRKGVEFDE